MIQSVHIRNFRCFEEASLQDCRTLNVVVGKNASGKTALLEALFLAVGPSPEIALRYRAWHGYEGAHQGTPQDIDEAVWGDLFHRFERDRVVSVALEGTGRHTRTLTIEWSRERSLNPVFDPGSRQIGIPSAAIFKWTRGNEPPFTVQPISTPGMGYQFPGAEGYAVEATFFASNAPVPNLDNVRRFSGLSKRRQEREITKDIHGEFGFIVGVDIQALAGQTLLHGDLPALPEKVPLNMVSSGVSKFVTLALAIASQKGGLLFVDEIENGFHYERFPTLWKTLYALCKANNVQLFASTHSRECLDGLEKALGDKFDDVSFMRGELGSGLITSSRL